MEFSICCNARKIEVDASGYNFFKKRNQKVYQKVKIFEVFNILEN